MQSITRQSKRQLTVKTTNRDDSVHFKVPCCKYSHARVTKSQCDLQQFDDSLLLNQLVVVSGELYIGIFFFQFHCRYLRDRHSFVGLGQILQRFNLLSRSWVPLGVILFLLVTEVFVVRPYIASHDMEDISVQSSVHETLSSAPWSSFSSEVVDQVESDVSKSEQSLLYCLQMMIL